MTYQKDKSYRAVCALAIAACMLLGVVFAERIAADEGVFPTLYCNDEVWYKEDILPLERYYQSYYMPVSVLESFEGVSITENERFGTLLITRTDDSTLFISFNTNKNSAMTDTLGEFYVLTFTREGERYIPVETVCSSLGLTAEFYTSSSSEKTALRICDGKQKKSFDELIAMYAFEGGSDSGGDDTTLPPVIDPPVPLDAKTVYLTFDNINSNMLDPLLAELAEHNKKATFFVNVNKDVDLAALVKLASAGHSIGLTFNTDGYEASPVASFSEQNKTLIRALKYSVRFARIYGDESSAAYIEALDKAEAGEYIIWGWDFDLFADDARDIVVNLASLDAGIKDDQIMTLRFYGNDLCLDMLAQTLDYLDDKVSCTAKTINDATKSEH